MRTNETVRVPLFEECTIHASRCRWRSCANRLITLQWLRRIPEQSSTLVYRSLPQLTRNKDATFMWNPAYHDLRGATVKAESP